MKKFICLLACAVMFGCSQPNRQSISFHNFEFVEVSPMELEAVDLPVEHSGWVIDDGLNGRKFYLLKEEYENCKLDIQKCGFPPK
jgi:hypothetical protein